MFSFIEGPVFCGQFFVLLFAALEEGKLIRSNTWYLSEMLDHVCWPTVILLQNSTLHDTCPANGLLKAHY